MIIALSALIPSLILFYVDYQFFPISGILDVRGWGWVTASICVVGVYIATSKLLARISGGEARLFGGSAPSVSALGYYSAEVASWLCPVAGLVIASWLNPTLVQFTGAFNMSGTLLSAGLCWNMADVIYKELSRFVARNRAQE